MAVRDPGQQSGERPLVRLMRDGTEFIHDVFWLVGWVFRWLAGKTGAARTPEGGLRGGCGCLLSALAVVAGALLWRRERRSIAAGQPLQGPDGRHVPLTDPPPDPRM